MGASVSPYNIFHTCSPYLASMTVTIPAGTTERKSD